ncbi:PAS domain-containing protein [Salidesulfovibrio onnuriiensis]|uniref:PAS domain-containing protein n=1 Tax=Salidesulfovibrio onnuriiensis TaxID=2583823 RepID=UPI0011CC362E|nr:PAS domain-containing protein [Salidesulfovibrio onnuriiensis]
MSLPVILLTVLAYLGVLFALAFLVEHNERLCRAVQRNPYIYCLSIGIYCTSWTFFGAVGRAANIGVDVLAVFLGASLTYTAAWLVVRKLAAIKESFKTTSIADFLSTRYSHPQLLAGLVTFICLLAIMPYIALQLKSVISTTMVLMARPGSETQTLGQDIGQILCLLMSVFTILFGARRIDPTERHQGMIAAIAIQSVVKLAAILACGFFVVFMVHDGFADVYQKALEVNGNAMFLGSLKARGVQGYLTWGTMFLMSMCAGLFLPRQFHVAVVENSDLGHTRTATWFFPLYLIAFNVFVMPLAYAGIAARLPLSAADTYVLTLPLHHGNTGLALFVFIGGFSAAISMIMISAMTTSTMFVNHLLLPLFSRLGIMGTAGRFLLQWRWASIVGVIFLGYLFAQGIGNSYALVSIGLISFAAATQFAPAFLGTLFWRRTNFAGAFGGLLAGFMVWFYTLLLPAMIKSGWIQTDLLENGPFGIALLRPEALFGLTEFPPLANSLFWSLFFNVCLFLALTLAFEQTDREKQVAEEFVSVLDASSMGSLTTDVEVDLDQKTLQLSGGLQMQLGQGKAVDMVQACRKKLGLGDTRQVDVVDYARLFREVERSLSGVFGYAMAKQVLKRDQYFTDVEQRALSEGYGRILARLNLPPRKLLERIDYHEEREHMLEEHGRELDRKIRERDKALAKRKATEAALKASEEKFHSIFENALEGIFQSTPEGRFLTANPAMASMLGYGSPQHLVETVTDISRELYVDPNQRKELLATLQKEGRAREFDVELYRADRSKMWMGLHLYPKYDDAGNLLYMEGIGVDITRRKLSEQGLKRYQDHLEDLMAQKSQEAQNQEDLLGEILGCLDAGMVVMDREANTVLKANEAAERLLGTERANIVGLPCEAIPGLTPDGGQCIIDASECGAGLRETTITSGKGRKIPVLQCVLETRFQGDPALVLVLVPHKKEA